ncbi:MAG: hypothetical protein HPY89_02550 [Pelotomaculum sp.]|nr:hypothetical protein [Pelotomaculum sp.]
MFEKTHRLIKFFEKSGGITGRKKLQKIVYVLQSLGYPYGMDYIYCHYGPYSPQLQFEVDRLAEKGLINEQYFNQAYQYSITEEGRELGRFLDEKNKGIDRLEVPGELLSELIRQDAQFLELVATIIYIKNLGYGSETTEQKVKELKPHLTDRYSEALTFIEKIEKWII